MWNAFSALLNDFGRTRNLLGELERRKSSASRLAAEEDQDDDEGEAIGYAHHHRCLS